MCVQLKDDVPFTTERKEIDTKSNLNLVLELRTRHIVHLIPPKTETSFTKTNGLGGSGKFRWLQTMTRLHCAGREERVSNKGIRAIDPASVIKDVNELKARSSLVGERLPRVGYLAEHAGGCSRGRPAAHCLPTELRGAPGEGHSSTAAYP